MIRLPNIPANPQTQIGNPAVRTEAISQGGEAVVAAAESVARVSSAFHGLAIDIQKQENAKRLAELRTNLRLQYAGLQQELATEQDPAQHIARTQNFFAAQRNSFMGQDLPPAVMDAAALEFDDMASRGTLAATESAVRLQRKRTLDAFQNDYETAIQLNDPEALNRAIGNLNASGLSTPEEAEQLMRQGQSQLASQQYQQLVMEDPMLADKELDDPDFLKKHPEIGHENWMRLRSAAESKANQQRSQMMDELIINDKLPASEQEVQELYDAGMLTASDAARLAHGIRTAPEAPVTHDDPVVYESTYSETQSYDPAADPSGQGVAALRSKIASSPLTSEGKKELNRRLNERIETMTTNRPAGLWDTHFNENISSEFNRGALFGGFRFPDPADPTKFKVNYKQWDAARQSMGRFKEEWAAIKERLGPDATFDDHQKAFDAHKERFRAQTPPPDLGLPGNPGLPFQPDSLYSGSKGKETSMAAPIGEFGGQPIPAVGGTFNHAGVTIFGGPNDPADNGLSAFGGKTGDGGRQGVALPKDVMATKFPGKNKKWIADNVRVIVRADNGVSRSLKMADFGTAEWVWQRKGKPVLDLTEGAVRELGGRPTYNANGKLSGISGFSSAQFATVSIETSKPLSSFSTFEEARQDWFQTTRPSTHAEASLGQVALADAWQERGMTRKNPTETAYNTDEVTRIAETPY